MLVVRGYRPPPVQRTSSAVSGAIREGVRHVAHARSLRNPVIRVAVISATGASLVALLPIIAKDQLSVDEGGFGLLSGSLGLGSVAAVWLLPRLGAARSPERATIIAAVLWSIGAALFAVAEQLWMGLAALLLAGAGTMGMINVLWSNFTLQLQSWVRGRGSAVEWARGALQRAPSLLGLEKLLALRTRLAPEGERADIELTQRLIHSQTQRLSRYVCGHCGFKALQYYWQCPGCARWDSYAPKRSEELERG